MSYSTYWSYLYSVALLNLCLVGECAVALSRPDPLKGVYGKPLRITNNLGRKEDTDHRAKGVAAE